MPADTPLRLGPTTVLLRGLLLVVVLAVPLATFAFPAALGWRAGAPWPLALTLGLVAFPLMPLAWHLAGELRRRGQTSKGKTFKGKTMRPGDRLALRTGLSCVLVLTLVGIGWGSSAWHAVEHSKRRIELAAIGSTGLDAAPVAALDPAVVALIPAGATSLFAIPDPYGVIDRLVPEKTEMREVLARQWREDCGVDATQLSVFGGFSTTDFFVVMHVPGLDPDALHCMERVPRARLRLPEGTELEATAIVGGYRMSADMMSDDEVRVFLSDSGALVATSPGWGEEMAQRIASGGPIDLDAFAGPLARIEALDHVDLWAVTVESDPGWEDGSAWAYFRDDTLNAGATVTTATPQAATELAEGLREQLGTWSAAAKTGGVDLGPSFGIDVTANSENVELVLSTDMMAMFWSVWSSAMVQGLTTNLTKTTP